MTPAKSDPDVRDRIIRHASSRFFAESFSGLTMEQVAQELQISKKTLYKHFANKSELIRACMREFMLETQARVGAATGTEMDLIENIANLFNVLSTRVTMLGRNFIAELGHSAPEILVEIDRFRVEKIHNLFHALHARGIASHDFIDHPSTELAELMIATTRAVASPEFVLQSGIPLSRALPLLLEIMIGGMLTAKGRQRFENLKKNAGRKQS